MQPSQQGPHAYAIDFGTSNSLIALADKNGAHPPIEIDPGHFDPKIMRSIYFISEDGRWTFGSAAVDHYTQTAGQGRLIRSIKKYLPDESFQGTKIGGRMMSLVDIVSMFLKELRTKANAATGLDVETVVLGRPAVFSLSNDKDQLAENRLRAAALQAGFKDIHFCPEPVAAGLALDSSKEENVGRIYLICDFGGGTSDYSVIRFRKGESFDVLAIGGVSLAGDHFDGSIMKHMVSPLLGADITYKMPMGRNELRLPTHIITRMCSAPDINFIGQTEAYELLQAIKNWSLDADKKTRLDKLLYIIEERLGYRLFDAIERSKISLSSSDEAAFNFQHYDVSVDGKFTSEAFTTWSEPVTDKILASLDETVKQAGLTYEQIDAVVCTGGTAKIASLSAGLSNRFDQSKIRRTHEFHSVIHGLTKRAAELCR